MTTDDTPRLISDMRGVRYGEVLAVFAKDGGFEAEVYGTQMLNDCPQELWDSLDPAAIAAEMGAWPSSSTAPGTGCSTDWARRWRWSSRCSATSAA